MSDQIFEFNQITNYESYKKFVGKNRVFLGKGVNGRVYKVYINKTMPIAVKKIDLPQDDEACLIQEKNLKKEAELQKNMDHPNIVKVYFNFKNIDEQRNERHYYVGMEYIEKDLEKLLKEKKKLTEYEISNLASQIQSAMAYLEQKKIAHRDLKPANILITSQGTYKLCDFSEYKWQEQTLKTFQNTLAGTPNYLSPELMTFYLNYSKKLKDNKKASNQLIYDPYKSDVFSFGLVLIQCLLGCHETSINVLNSNENALQDILRNQCSEHLHWFLTQCMSFNPSERLTFNEMIQIFRINPIECTYKIFKLNDEITLLKKKVGCVTQTNQLQEETQNLKKEIENLNMKILQMEKHLTKREVKIYQNGDKYDGEWKNGKQEGKGIFYFANGAKYDGEWKNGIKEGKGIFYWQNGEKYDGEWKNDKQEGKGILYRADGAMYDGEWKNDNCEGKGIICFPNGGYYEGEFKNSIKEGKGISYDKSGNKYDGEWKNDRKEGKGIVYWANGDKYEGEWKNNKREGKGIYYTANWTTKFQKYKNGQLIN